MATRTERPGAGAAGSSGPAGADGGTGPAGPAEGATGAARTAIGAARGPYRALLAATCAALLLAAIGDEATGYDGPGPFVYLVFALAVALLRWRFTPLLAAAMSVFFTAGGLSSAAFLRQLGRPGHALAFTAGWAQLLGFAVAGVCAVAAVAVRCRALRRTRTRTRT